MRGLLLSGFLIATLLMEWGTPARADGGTGFRRTTPRASLAGSRDLVVIGIPGGRAWGIESDLRPLPEPDATLVVRLAVEDPLVREAFVRVAYYASSSGRGAQLSTTDSAPVASGERALVTVELDPPSGAVAYRVRVLARLFAPTARSSDDAVTAVLHLSDGAGWRRGSLYSRLLP